MTSAVIRKTGTQLLYLAVDLGETPRFDRFAEQVSCVETLQRYSRALAEPEIIRESSPPYTQHDVAELTEKLDALELPDAQRHLLNEMLQVDEPGSPLNRLEVTELSAIQVVRTSMSSPWVTVMADVVRHSQPAAYGLAALLGLHKLLRMVMEWQEHRQGLRERRSAFARSELLSLLARHEQAVEPMRVISDEARHEATAAITRLDQVLAADVLEPDDPLAKPGQ